MNPLAVLLLIRNSFFFYRVAPLFVAAGSSGDSGGSGGGSGDPDNPSPTLGSDSDSSSTISIGFSDAPVDV